MTEDTPNEAKAYQIIIRFYIRIHQFSIEMSENVIENGIKNNELVKKNCSSYATLLSN